MKKEDLTDFQVTLLENLLMENEVLRHGHSEPVVELIQAGLIEKKDGVFIASKKAKKLKL